MQDPASEIGTLDARPDRRIRFLELLGQGGFGAVYRAEIRGGNGLVQHMAVKVLSREMVAHSDLAARQRDEARLLARLRHHAIVSVHDLTEVGGRPAVLMELVEGIDAAELRASSALTPRAAMQIIAETASALDAAWSSPDPETGHPLRVVHRDIKPANLLVSVHGGVKVLDFGIARANFDREGITGSMQFGTARYMAPEQWLSGTVGHAVDVYALGVSLVELMTGEPLARAPLQPERFASHVQNAVEAVVRQTGEAPGIRSLVQGMLSFDAPSRPTADQVREAALTLGDSLPGAQLARLAPQIIPTLMAARRERLSGRTLPGSVPLGEQTTAAPPAIAPGAPPALPTHLLDLPTGRPQVLTQQPRSAAPEDSGRTIAPPPHPARLPAPRSAASPHWRRTVMAAGGVAVLLTGGAGVLAMHDPAWDSREAGETQALERPPVRPIQGGAEPPSGQPVGPSAREAEMPSRSPSVAESNPHPPPEERSAASPQMGRPDATASVQKKGSPTPVIQQSVTLSSEPIGARVWVDGREVGTTPVIGFPLSEGDHEIRMVLGETSVSDVIRVRRMRPVSEVRWRVDSGRLAMQ